MTISNDDYERHDGLGLAKLVHSGEVSPRDLMERAVAISEERNPAVNALCFQRYDHALEQADKAKQKAAETTKTQRILTAIAVALAIAAVCAWGLYGDIPVVPV